MTYDLKAAQGELEDALECHGSGGSYRRKDALVNLRLSQVGTIEAFFWENTVSYEKDREYRGPGALGDGNFGWLLALKDGGWAVLTGWHDYTGWDCYSGLKLSLWPTKLEAIRLGMTNEERDLFGIPQPESKP